MYGNALREVNRAFQRLSTTRYLLEGAGHGDLSFLGDTKAGLPWSTNQPIHIIVDILIHSIGVKATSPARIIPLVCNPLTWGSGAEVSA
jgi:hypothetical protein